MLALSLFLFPQAQSLTVNLEALLEFGSSLSFGSEPIIRFFNSVLHSNRFVIG